MVACKVTSVDVAAKAGVSQSAVSRTFTPGASVSLRTAEKVHAAATALGYRPNSLARSLITGKSRMIGFIVAYLDNQFYPESLQKLSQQLQAQGYHLLIFTVDNTQSQVENIVEELLNYQVDAIIAASVSLNTALAERCLALGVPIVLYNRTQDDTRISSVTSDNHAGGYSIAEHFSTIGIRRPAYIAGWEGASTQRDREAGFIEGLRNHGLELFDRAVGGFDHETAKQATRMLFCDKTIKPDGLFVANDHMAFAVMDVLRYELGMDIPEDVVVAGYDDVAIASWPAYDLTSVRQPANRMVEATVTTVLAMIENPDMPPQQIAIQGPLIPRRSTTSMRA